MRAVAVAGAVILVLCLVLKAIPAAAQDTGASIEMNADPFRESAPAADPFRAVPGVAAPKPAPRPRPGPGREPQEEAGPVAVVPPPAAPIPPPAAPLLDAYDGVNGIWHVRAYRTGNMLTGEIECTTYGKLRRGPSFQATLDAAGHFDVRTRAANGWPLRQISGTFPQVTIHAVNFDKYLSCPDGGVTLQRTGAAR